MIRKALVLSFVISCLAFSSCQKAVKIGFSVGDFSSDRWSQEPQLFEQVADSLGAEVLFAYAYGDADQQLEQVKNLLDSGIQVLVVFPTNAENWTEVVDLAHKKGIKVVAYERMLNNAGADYYFSFFNEDVGRKQAQYALEHCPMGNYVLLGGPTNDANSLLFMKGQREVLASSVEQGDVKILLEKHLATWNSIDAYNVLQAFLDSAKLKPDAILAANDELAGGSIMALDMSLGDWSNIVITGQDASAGGCQQIINGKQSMTVYKSIRNLTHEAATGCVKLAQGKKPTNINAIVTDGSHDVPAVLLPVITVDIHNLKETVVADGFLKEDQLNFNP
jgi:D-xylose transport system substrate-binding protein